MSTWTRTELLLALNLYFETPFGKQHRGHPPIIALANTIGRTPSAVAMKLNNFTSLDSTELARGIAGLGNASRMDRQIWDEFQKDPESLVVEIEKTLAGSKLSPQENAPPEELKEPTETTAEVRVRLQQHFFRRIVLGSYDLKCCVTGNPIRELLRASHIIPWSHSAKDRLNPRNGLCLAATFDAAFDRGLIWFDENYQLRIGNSIRHYSKNAEISQIFLSREGQQIRLPEKNLPDPSFIAWHRVNIANVT